MKRTKKTLVILNIYEITITHKKIKINYFRDLWMEIPKIFNLILNFVRSFKSPNEAMGCSKP